MRKFTDTLTPSQVYRFAIDFCQPYLAFKDERGHPAFLRAEYGWPRLRPPRLPSAP